jgi:hypothetical protein
MTKARAVARVKAHKAFDTLWKSRHMTRDEAYTWLANRMNRPKLRTHISYFGTGQCMAVIVFVNEYWENKHANTS